MKYFYASSFHPGLDWLCFKFPSRVGLVYGQRGWLDWFDYGDHCPIIVPTITGARKKQAKIEDMYARGGEGGDPNLHELIFTRDMKNFRMF